MRRGIARRLRAAAAMTAFYRGVCDSRHGGVHGSFGGRGMGSEVKNRYILEKIDSHRDRTNTHLTML